MVPTPAGISSRNAQEDPGILHGPDWLGAALAAVAANLARARLIALTGKERSRGRSETSARTIHPRGPTAIPGAHLETSQALSNRGPPILDYFYSFEPAEGTVSERLQFVFPIDVQVLDPDPEGSLRPFP